MSVVAENIDLHQGTVELRVGLGGGEFFSRHGLANRVIGRAGGSLLLFMASVASGPGRGDLPSHGSTRGSQRVLRGGGWYGNARDVRAAYRYWDAPCDRSDVIGFRCARVQGREPGKQGEGAERANLARPGPRSGSGRAAAGSVRAAALGQDARLRLGRFAHSFLG